MAQESLFGFTDEEKDAAEAQIQERAKRIEYYITEFTIEILAQKTRQGEYVVPAYQREFTWEESRKWRFIESVLMGLPIPFIFFWEDPSTGKLEIVDGSQRLRTLEEFVYNELALGDLEKLPAVSGFRFCDLPEARQRKLFNRSIRGIVLSEFADEEARFDLFERINTGSKVANKAEVRRGALRGPFLDLVVELAKDPVFQSLAPVSEKQLKEREPEELVTRFFAYGDGLEDYADEVSPFLFSYSRHTNKAFEEDPSLVDAYRERFHRTMAFVQKAIPYGFRRTPTGKATPRSRFEGIAIGTYLALQAKPDLQPDPVKTEGWLKSERFIKEARSDGANAIGRLEGRIGFVRDSLLGTVA
ncbi:DUF262 domain-containing protein [Paraburkholderia largidicola]|uniref:GmrSD restriction endonucleases N-terminal domain-containing protein n=1 Tax=Paraburkholderia largidicola TaxID=3014751 RepID=A0A7I8BNL6_9BURK|nr:DUF262 domain-containing protein [Paraburkholderia sp. PGU16]BCF90103.1 hypothetical protein PPGU16_31700 [Paraburkholderia sp. PGU16]